MLEALIIRLAVHWTREGSTNQYRGKNKIDLPIKVDEVKKQKDIIATPGFDPGSSGL